MEKPIVPKKMREFQSGYKGVLGVLNIIFFV